MNRNSVNTIVVIFGTTLSLIANSLLFADTLEKQESLATNTVTETPAEAVKSKHFEPKDFSNLFGMPGFSDSALTMHFTLYKGYVKNANILLETLSKYNVEGTTKSVEYAELKRRLGWELDGMRLHELYFENLGSEVPLDPNSALYATLIENFGSFDLWKNDFVSSGLMRGIGWVVLYKDPLSGRLINMWINEHDVGHLAGGTPLLIMDVFEHAYLPDYQLDRAKYIDAFFKNINWNVVEKRLQMMPVTQVPPASQNIL